ncbi:MBL fold metallo-hydrolase [Oscillatoria amoena NRMC-F 0135]|nr:MBL fold metallo-hydrolase [Oscillatoria amoena NRMC-F 0135]
MKVEQIYTGCLAQGAYYIVSGNEAAIIDPLREIQPYIERAEKDGVTIKYVLETHFHADFVSGHIDLAKATGAQIVYGPTAKPAFDAYVAKDGEELTLGKVRIEVLHTPGHTMESSCFLLKDENGNANALFTGDTLFIGDVGRPDLAQKAANLTKEELAGLLYESLRTKVMTLPDEVVVYPAHGAGSACGKNMSKETVSTIGAQKQTNYALRANMTKEEFVKEVTDGLMPPPVYFPQNARMNKEGYEAIDTVLQRGQSALSIPAFEAAANETGALIIDTRNPEDFVTGFIPNSINIGINGNFAPWVGALITDVKQPLLLVCEPGSEEEVVTRLARVGYDNVIGYLKGGFEVWRADGKETDEIETISAFEFAHRQSLHPMPIIDVRKPGEYDAEHVVNAINIPLDYISENMATFPQNETFYLHCAGGYRSVIAASILKARGYTNMINVEGGFNAIKETPVARTEFVCQTTSK